MTTSSNTSNSPTTASRTEIAFVADNLPDFQTLISGLRSGVQVVVLDSTRDALAQMVQALQGQTDLAAIHLLSHGAAGRIELGALTLSSDNLNDYQAQLAQIGASLAADGDLLVYGCSVGANGAFVAQLASLTQADVAASDDLTGASALGGNWVLETEVGRIESALALGDAGQLGYAHVLALFNVTLTDNSTDPGSLRYALLDGVNSPGGDNIVLKGLDDGSIITLTGSAATLGDGDMLDFTGAGNKQLVIAGSSGGGLTLAGVGKIAVGGSNSPPLPSLTISADISGVGSLEKLNPKLLVLSGNNTYAGTTTITAGGLTVSGGAAIADTSAVSVALGATLTLGNSETIGSLAGAGNVVLGANTLTAGGNDTNTTFAGVASGAGSLVKAGIGKLILSGANTYTGTTTVLAGELNIASHNNISSGNVLLNGGMLSLTGHGINDASGDAGSGYDFFANDIAIGAAGGNLFAQNAQWFITGALTGSGALTSSGNGILILNNASGLTGPIFISDGLLEVSGTSTLGGGQVTLADSTQLYVAGVTKTLSNNMVLAGSATLATETQSSFNNADFFAAGAIATFSGVISESGGPQTLTLRNDSVGNAFVLSGTNTYTGGTVLDENTKVFVSADANLGVGGNVTLKAGSVLSVTADATLNHDLVLAGAAAATLEVGSGVAATVSGVVSGGNDLSKTGAGVLTLSGTNTYTGTTTVNVGTLLVDGATSGNGAVSVASGATLGGTGSIAGAINLASGATLTAGTTSTTEDLAIGDLAVSGKLSAQIGGNTAGSGYDQIKVTGTVSLAGAALDASFISGFTSARGNSYTLIANDASDAVNGTFSGLAEGTTLTLGGRTLSISYAGGTDRNDVVLTDVTANTSPVLDVSKSPSLPSVLENASDLAGITVANLVADDTITDADGSAVKAIAITALDTRLGAWQYSLDNGRSWLTIRADLINSGTNELALLLGPTAQLRLLPFGGLSGTLSEAFTFRAWDMSSGAQGDYATITGAGSGNSAFSSAADTASLTVTAVNDAPTFAPVAGTGKAVIPVGNYGDTGQSISMQPDGKIIVAGYSEKSDYPDFSLIRLNANGTLDTSFAASTGGKLLIPIGIYHDRSHSVAVQADGKIVLAGDFTSNNSGQSSFGLVRLNTDGTLDNSFDGDGKVTVLLSDLANSGNSVTIQTDGKIILAGTSTSAGNSTGPDFSLIRLNVDGSLDTSFDGDGKAIFAISPYDESGSSVIVQADGKIVLAGSSVNLVTSSDFSLIRLNADGSLDTTFGDVVSGVHTGKAIIDIAGSTDYGRSLTVQADGKFILAGSSYSATSSVSDFSLVRLNADGSLDASFDGDGKFLLSASSGDDQILSVVVQPDGKILFAGSSVVTTPDPHDPHGGGSGIQTSAVTLVRLSPNGVLDSSFGAGGIASMSTGISYDHGYGLTLQPDGKIVVGYGDISTVYNFAVMRLNADGSLDTSFNGSAANTLGTTAAYTEDGLAAALDTTVAIFDADLAALNGGIGNYNGASITLMRHEGGNTADVFSAMGNLSLLGGAATLTESGSPVTIGTFTNTAGTLAITFNSLATQARVNTVLSSVGYANTSHAPPASVQIDWIFSDGNTGDQGDGGALTAADSTTVTITAVNDAPTISGVPVTSQAVITGTAAALADFTVADKDGTDVILNVTLSASNGTVNGLTDEDTNTAGIQLSGTAAAINTALAAATFTATAAGAASIVISVEDGQAAPVTATYNLVASAVVIPAPVNNLPTGSVTISGTATQGQTLTAANTLADLDGLGTISYKWTANGVDIAGATATTFTLTKAEVGKVITAVARYTDAQGTIESVASSATAAVVKVNDLPTGSVTISGTATQGQTLTAANTLVDLDGLGTISYQWMAGSNAITGATGSTLVLGQDQVGKTITVIASYTDGASTAESVSSIATAVVTNTNDAPTGSVTISGTATQGQTLTAANTLADLDGLGTISYQWMAGGVDINGATTSTFTLTQAEVGKVITAVARYTDAQGTIESVASSASAVVARVNTTPVISGIPPTVIAVTIGTPVALTGLVVADVDGMNVTLNVTLLPSNGTINGLADADANTVGIQLSGTAALINAALAAATFTATAGGAATIGITVSDGLGVPVTATYSLTATSEPVPPAGDGDNIPNVIEDGAPGLPPANGGAVVAGDGNGDGVPDSQQVQVTSLSILNTPTAQSAPGNATSSYISLVAGSVDGKIDPASTSNPQITRLVQQDAPSDLPVELKMPQGLLNFSASLQPNADNSPVVESFSLYVDASTGANGYWVQNANNIWCNLASEAYGGKIVLEGGKLRLDFRLVDGGEFDTDGLTNGSVGNLGAAGNMPLSLVGAAPTVPDGGFWF